MIIMPEAFNDAMSINHARNRYIDNYPYVMSLPDQREWPTKFISWAIP